MGEEGNESLIGRWVGNGLNGNQKKSSEIGKIVGGSSTLVKRLEPIVDGSDEVGFYIFQGNWESFTRDWKLEWELMQEVVLKTGTTVQSLTLVTLVVSPLEARKLRSLSGG